MHGGFNLYRLRVSILLGGCGVGTCSYACRCSNILQQCSNILQQWRDLRLEFLVLSDLARNTFCVMATSAANEWVFSMDGHVMNSRRSNLKTLSVNDILIFNRAVEPEVKYPTPSPTLTTTLTPIFPKFLTLTYQISDFDSLTWREWNLAVKINATHGAQQQICFNKSFKRNYHFNRNSQFRSVM